MARVTRPPSHDPGVDGRAAAAVLVRAKEGQDFAARDSGSARGARRAWRECSPAYEYRPGVRFKNTGMCLAYKTGL